MFLLLSCQVHCLGDANSFSSLPNGAVSRREDNITQPHSGYSVCTAAQHNRPAHTAATSGKASTRTSRNMSKNNTRVCKNTSMRTNSIASSSTNSIASSSTNSIASSSTVQHFATDCVRVHI